jgi:hypothetical protein
MAAMSIAITSSLYNPELEFKYDLILSPSPPPRSSTLPSLGTPNSPDSLDNNNSAFQGPTTQALPHTTLRKAIFHQKLHMGLSQQHQHQQRARQHKHPFLHEIQTTSLHHKKTHSTQLAGKLEDIMSSPLLIAPIQQKNHHRASSFTAPSSPTSPSQDYVYTAPCEHHPSKGQTDYLVNDMFPKLTVSFCLQISFLIQLPPLSFSPSLFIHMQCVDQ